MTTNPTPIITKATATSTPSSQACIVRYVPTTVPEVPRFADAVQRSNALRFPAVRA